MNSRERVEAALDHRPPDLVPLDLGGSPVTGMAASSVYMLRQALGPDPPETPVKVVEPFQMLGEIGADLIEALGIDVMPLAKPTTMFGFRNEGWKPWTLPDGTPGAGAGRLRHPQPPCGLRRPAWTRALSRSASGTAWSSGVVMATASDSRL